jgi:hypothetical protein
MENSDEYKSPVSRVMRSARVLTAYYEHKLKLSLEILSEAPKEPVDEGVQFDMLVGSWGIWGLRSSRPLGEKVQSEISASFHSLLSAMDSMEKKQFDLQRLQEKYEAATADLPSNVIPIRRMRPALTNAGAFGDKRWLVKQDCLIESKDILDIHKMALELHSHSKRYVFLDYRDLDRSTQLNLSELLQLGRITLFVANIMDLKMEEQETLFELAAQEPSNRPLLMVGANMSYSALRTEPAIHLDFLLLLSRAYIKLTRPFSEYRDKGLIHYFLDSLAQNPS